MKILFIGTDDIHTPKWIRYFKQRGYKCLFHCIEPSRRSILQELHYLKSECEAFKPEIVHTHYAGRNGLIGTLLNFHPHVITVHGSEVLLSNWWKKRMVRWILKRADMITTDSRIIERKLWGWGVSAFNVEYIRFGVDTNFWKPEPPDPEIPNLNIKARYPTIISTRNLEPVYDIETLLRAFQIVQDNIPNVRLNIIGEGSRDHDLKFLSQQLGLKYVKFFGRCSPAVVLAALRHAWVYVSTALSDAGLASSTAEAMACELPCVVTNVAENRKWVEGVFSPGYYEGLARTVSAFISNANYRETIGRLARQRIVKYNNYHVEMRKMETLYTDILRRRKTNGKGS